MFRSIFSFAFLSVFGLSNAALAADIYPSKPITMVVPFGPGGGNDLLGRLMATHMSKSLGQPVIVENKAGAGGVVGTRYVAQSAPDGYKILLAFTGTMAVNPVLYRSAGFNTEKDFAPIGRIGTLPMVLVVNSSSKWKSLQDLISAAKAKPGKYSFGSGGAGTLLHLAPEMIANRVGIDLLHIPYKSTAQAAADLLGGQIDMMFSSPVAVAGAIKSDRLRAIAVTGPTRTETLPDVPTIAESGLPGFSILSSYGLLAPAGTPKPIIAKLNQALNDALASDEVKTRLKAEATVPEPGTPDSYAVDLKSESETWGAMVKKLGLKED